MQLNRHTTLAVKCNQNSISSRLQSYATFLRKLNNCIPMQTMTMVINKLTSTPKISGVGFVAKF